MPAWRPTSRTRTARADRTHRLRRYWDKHARSYDKQMAFWGTAAVRRRPSLGLRPSHRRGAGGRHRHRPQPALYPQDIHLTGLDFSPQMLQLARRRAEELGRQVDLRLGDAQALDLPDASFDTVVCTLSLCAIPDQRHAIAEMKRVLRPGGRLLLLDHVAGASRWVRAIQWLLEQFTRPLGGEHLRRRPLLQVQAEGFQIERAERSKLGIVERLAARKPAEPTSPS